MKIPLKLSYTKLSFYLACPYKYYLRYIKKLPYYPGKMTKYGGNIHRSIKEFSEIIKSGTVPEKEKQINLVESQWTKVTVDKDEDSRLKQLSIDQLGLFVQKNASVLADKNLFFEKSFKYQITDKVILNGYIDRVDVLDGSNIEIIDYKSGNERELYNDDLQLNFYALVCRDHFHLNSVKLSLYFLQTHTKLSVDASNSKINETRELILAAADEMLSENFKTTENSYNHCPFCFYNRQCRYAKI